MRSAYGGGHIKHGTPCTHKNCGCEWRLCDDISEQCFKCGATLKYSVPAIIEMLEREAAAREHLILDALSKGQSPRNIARDWGVSLYYIFRLQNDASLLALQGLA